MTLNWGSRGHICCVLKAVHARRSGLAMQGFDLIFLEFKDNIDKRAKCIKTDGVACHNSPASLRRKPIWFQRNVIYETDSVPRRQS